MNQQEQKQAAATAATAFIENAMVLGLGTGSTLEYALPIIREKIRQGMQLSGVPTSRRTAAQAQQFGISLLDRPEETESIDLTIDGADEVDSAGRLIKGGGGALTREKIVAAMSRKVIIIADQSKLVDQLGAFPLPVEVLPFGWKATANAIADLGARSVTLRQVRGAPYVTDNQLWILDCAFGRIENPEQLAAQLSAIPGVVEHGLFLGLCDFALIGTEGGSIQRVEGRRRKPAEIAGDAFS